MKVLKVFLLSFFAINVNLWANCNENQVFIDIEALLSQSIEEIDYNLSEIISRNTQMIDSKNQVKVSFQYETIQGCKLIEFEKSCLNNEIINYNDELDCKDI